MTDVDLDERVTALEENGGGGDTENGRNFICICFVFYQIKNQIALYMICKENLTLWSFVLLAASKLLIYLFSFS